MFKADLEMDKEGITVPYSPLFDDVRKNHGFLDVRGRPDLAAEIVEGADSPALKKLLIELARPESKLFSVGSDVGTKRLDGEGFPHTAGGYIQIMSQAYDKRTPEDYARLAQGATETLREKSEGHEWEVQFLLTPVRFKLDSFADMTGSLWIWFHAFAYTAKRALLSREALIAEIGHLLTDEHCIALLEQGVDG